MKQVEFLAIDIDRESSNMLRASLDSFSQKCNCHVTSNFVDWDNIWRELVQIGIYRRGADLSEVGTSWLDSLTAMNAVRLISNKEIKILGGESAFLPATWQSVIRAGIAEAEGIPFRADVRVIFYWKDMIAAAGLDEEQIFRTAQGMYTDMEALQRVCPTPWGATNEPGNRNTLHYMASWVWGAGGNFMAANGKQVAFTSPQALQGMEYYYKLGRFLPETQAPISDAQIVNLFLERKVAAMLAGPWFFTLLHNQNWTAEQIARIGIASPPGPPFVGGTCLALWQHCKEPAGALELINFLTSTELQVEYCIRTGSLPVRQETWAQPPYSTHPHYQAMYQALLKGRAFRPISLWGLVEERLAPVLGQIWTDLHNNPGADLPTILHENLDPVALRLNITLSG